jgi:hypothetical protein
MIVVAGTDYITIAGSPAAQYDFGGDIGVVPLRMDPVGPGNTNTIRKRLENAHLPTPTSRDSVPFEVVLISTVSERPFEVQGRLCDLRLRTTPGKRSLGKLTLWRDKEVEAKQGVPGGFFASAILAYFIADFIPVDDPSARFPMSASIVLETQEPGEWSTQPADHAVRVVGPVDSNLANVHTALPDGCYDFHMVGSVFDGASLLAGGHTAAAATISADGPQSFDVHTLTPLPGT